MLSLPWMLKNKMSCKKTWTVIKYTHRRSAVLAITEDMWNIQDGSIPSRMQGMKAPELSIKITLSCKNNLYMCKEMYTWRLSTLLVISLVEKPRKAIVMLLLLLSPQNVWGKACHI